ncbi:hypothetical protein DL764_005420 [Monosporascus ibericus]|uniref:Uncharacterized protein n=1 Tax=Monosporascus ibericus TaxID=155417 RepID=A0A4Q4T924_9PEZI|nr:hypothetical protein DL764_005420 [Monosporascus ibericus]
MGKSKGSRFQKEPDEVTPSRRDLDDRQLPREFEKAHGYGYNEVILLALLGIATICNVEKSLKHCEERHQKKEIEEMRARDAERWREEEREVRKLQGTRGAKWGEGHGGGSPSYRGSAPSSSSSRSKGSSKELRGRDWGSDDGRGGGGATTVSRGTRNGHRGYSRDGGARPKYYGDGCGNQYDERYGDQYDDRYDSRYDDRYYDRRRARSAELHRRRGSL